MLKFEHILVPFQADILAGFRNTFQIGYDQRYFLFLF